MKLVVPLPPNAANSRRHWRVALKEKKAYWADLVGLKWAGRIPTEPSPAPNKSRIRVHLYVWNLMDTDNAFARLKPLLDWLQRWGYIADDSPKHLEWDGIPEQTIDRKNMRVEIELEAA